MTLATSVHEIKSLILSFHPILVVETVEEQRLRRILQSVAQQARLTLFEWSITRGLTKAEQAEGMNRQTAAPLDALHHLDRLTVEGIFFLKDFGPHLKDPQVARQLRETAQRFGHSRSALVVSGSNIDWPRELEPLAVRYTLRMPGPNELRDVVQAVAQSMDRGSQWNLKVPESVEADLVRALQGLTLNQARQAVAHAIVRDGRLHSESAKLLLDHKVQLLKEGGLLEYYPASDNRFDLGGFENLRQWLARSAMGFTEKAKALNLTPPRGVLLCGVQGCGKSLAAKVIAREWGMPLLKLDMGSLYNKYMGETERNFRKALDLAESLSPCVLWLDEIEKALSTSSQSSSDDGVSRRVLGHFLTWLQENRQGIFVVATANDIHGLPPELMRKGRFDEIFFVDLPTAAERESILAIHLALREQDAAQFQLGSLAEATQGFSGAEIEQALIAALYRALHAGTRLTTGLILEEVQATVPLSQSRAEAIAQLRADARGRFVPV